MTIEISSKHHCFSTTMYCGGSGVPNVAGWSQHFLCNLNEVSNWLQGGVIGVYLLFQTHYLKIFGNVSRKNAPLLPTTMYCGGSGVPNVAGWSQHFLCNLNEVSNWLQGGVIGVYLSFQTHYLKIFGNVSRKNAPLFPTTMYCGGSGVPNVAGWSQHFLCNLNEVSNWLQGGVIGVYLSFQTHYLKKIRNVSRKNAPLFPTTMYYV